MNNQDDDDDLEKAIQQTVESLARKKGLSMEDVATVLDANLDQAKQTYLRRYAKVLRRELGIRNISEQELAVRVGLEGRQIFDKESGVVPETAALLIFRIPLALGIDPVDFASLMQKESRH